MKNATGIIRKHVAINASSAQIWHTLTDKMAEWMSDCKLEVKTTWKPQKPITFKGVWYDKHFDDKGIVLIARQEKVLRYSYLSSIAGLPDKPENYLIITFTLEPSGAETLLELTTENIHDEATYGHWNFYWTVTLGIIKRMAEGQNV